MFLYRSLGMGAWLIGLMVAACIGCHAQSVPTPRSGPIFVVRHAEKADPSNPATPLSSAGEARAASLAEVLRSRGIKAVFATEYIRTQQTVAPAARDAGVDVQVVQNAERASLIERARTAAIAGAVLIAGHSNTVPDIVKELSGEAVDGINENEFDNLFEVIIEADGHMRVVRSKYGEPPH